MTSARLVRALGAPFYALLDAVFRPLDQRLVRRTRALGLVPGSPHRRGGKRAYGEWCHVAGIFQALMAAHRPHDGDLKVLDVGCGTGLLAIAASPLLGPGGSYLGIDVSARDIDVCRRHYPDPRLEFVHLDAANPFYAPDQPADLAPWPVPDGSRDVVTALSVWTHLNEREAVFYFHEISRVLAPGGVALVTVFLVDGSYRPTDRPSPLHPIPPRQRLLDTPCSPSGQWLKPPGATVVEARVGMTPKGLDIMREGTPLELVTVYPGLWKDVPGPYYQDVVVLRRPR